MFDLDFEDIPRAAYEFQTSMGQDTNDISRHARLIAEELNELSEALDEYEKAPSVDNADNFIKEVADFYYVSAGSSFAEDSISSYDNDLANSCILILDVIEARFELSFENYLVYEAVRRVHESNMSKLGDDGSPIKDENGKVLKGPNYAPPYLTDLAASFFVRDQSGG